MSFPLNKPIPYSGCPGTPVVDPRGDYYVNVFPTQIGCGPSAPPQLCRPDRCDSCCTTYKQPVSGLGRSIFEGPVTTTMVPQGTPWIYRGLPNYPPLYLTGLGLGNVMSDIIGAVGRLASGLSMESARTASDLACRSEFAAIAAAGVAQRTGNGEAGRVFREKLREAQRHCTAQGHAEAMAAEQEKSLTVGMWVVVGLGFAGMAAALWAMARKPKKANRRRRRRNAKYGKYRIESRPNIPNAWRSDDLAEAEEHARGWANALGRGSYVRVIEDKPWGQTLRAEFAHRRGRAGPGKIERTFNPRRKRRRRR